MSDFRVEKAQFMTDYSNQFLCEEWLELIRFDPLFNSPLIFVVNTIQIDCIKLLHTNKKQSSLYI
jgi:hypothetical protein